MPPDPACPAAELIRRIVETYKEQQEAEKVALRGTTSAKVRRYLEARVAHRAALAAAQEWARGEASCT